jgi:hypothetical protein
MSEREITTEFEALQARAKKMNLVIDGQLRVKDQYGVSVVQCNTLGEVKIALEIFEAYPRIQAQSPVTSDDPHTKISFRAR